MSDEKRIKRIVRDALIDLLSDLASDASSNAGTFLTAADLRRAENDLRHQRAEEENAEEAELRALGVERKP